MSAQPRLSKEEFEVIALAASRGGAAERQVLVERLEPLIQATARRTTALAVMRGFRSLEVCDMEQEGRCLALELLPMWQPEKGDALVFFCFRVSHKMYELLKWTPRHAPAGESLESSPALARKVEGLTGAEDVELQEMDDWLRAAMKGLTEQHKYILWRAYWLDEDDEAIAAALKEPTDNVRQKRYRALRKLKAALTGGRDA